MEEVNTMANRLNPLTEKQIEQLAVKIREFLLEHEMWREVRHYENSGGL